MTIPKKIDIMGTTYRVIIEKKRDFPGCPSTEDGTCYGTCDYSTKKIHICGPLFRVDESGQIEDLGHFARSVLGMKSFMRGSMSQVRIILMMSR